MATYQPAKRATAWVGYISLVDQSDTKKMKSNPTIAAGDFKVSKDGGALANLTTLPSVTPASSVMVKIDLSATEMTADNVTVVCIDAAGAEWCDLVFNLQPSARQLDDLAYPATSGRSMVVDAAGLVDANAVKVGPSGSGTAQTAGDLAAMVTAVDDYVDTEVAAIKAKTDNLPADPADASDIAAAFATVNATLGTPAGASVSADIAAVKVDTAATLADTGTDGVVISSTTANQIADAFLNRDMSTGTDSGSTTVRTPRQALRALRNKSAVAASTLTVYKEDDSTASWTAAVTGTAGADPITAIDPAGP